MPLTLRPTGLVPGSTRTGRDYSVYTREWEVGRIYQTRGGPDSLRWFWSITVNGPMTPSDRVVSWDAWKAWAKLEGGALNFGDIGNLRGLDTDSITDSLGSNTLWLARALPAIPW